MKAIIEIGSREWTVSEKDVIRVPRLPKQEGDEIALDKVKAVIDEKETHFGTPYLDDVEVKAKVLGEEKGKKATVFKYKNKINYRRKTGYRDKLSVLKIESITVPKKA